MGNSMFCSTATKFTSSIPPCEKKIPTSHQPFFGKEGTEAEVEKFWHRLPTYDSCNRSWQL